MNIIYQDILKFLSKKPSKEELSERLFQLGHEHEINGEIFDFELTPNRGDCLSVLGIARDLNVFYGNSKSIRVYEGEIDELDIDFLNLSPEDCPQISFLEIEIEDEISSYRNYLENYFVSLGLNKTNFFTDISNYISYELGQPTHCFDKKRLKNKLQFENKECNQKFRTLLGSDVELSGKNCVFSNDNEIISLAGLMGGESTSCSSTTRKVLIECAYFKPESIIGKSVKYNLVSDAAHKFERGVDIESQEYALRRFIEVIQDHANIKSAKLKSFISKDFKHLTISLDENKINKILGIELSKDDYVNYLKDLGFLVSDCIQVPSFRHDIKSQNDLAEEIARVIGYNNFKNTPISFNNNNNETKINRIAALENFLIESGFSDVINFPFTSNKQDKSISIDNPLDSRREYFRTSLKDSLIDNLLYNERRQQDSIKIFEISDIYKIYGNEIKQEKKVGIIISGRLGNNYLDFSKKLDKDYLNNLLNENLETEVFNINEILRTDLDTKKKDKIFYVEIALDDIPEDFYENISFHKRTINFNKYQPISEFPKSTRDFSFSINNSKKVNEVIDHLNQVSDEIIKSSFMFDFYENKKEDTYKIGYRFIFQSLKKTLSDEEINNKVHEIINPIISIEGVSIPGLEPIDV